MSCAFSEVTVEALLMSNPSWQVQLALALVYTIFWLVVLRALLPRPVRAFVESWQAVDRVIAHFAAAMKKTGMPLELPEDRDFVRDLIVDFNGVYVQHMLGALLCLPSLMGFFSPSVASAMACHGAISEVGWEIQDSLMRAKELLFDGEVGRKRNPTILLVMYAFHHSVALCLVLPMNMYYHDNKHYHEVVALLQGAAVVAALCQQFGYTCNGEVRSERLQLKASVTLSFATMAWSRLVRGSCLWYILLNTLLADGRTTFFKVATGPVILMSLFNVMLVADAGKKFAKLVLELPSRDSTTDPNSVVDAPRGDNRIKGQKEPLSLAQDASQLRRSVSATLLGRQHCAPVVSAYSKEPMALAQDGPRLRRSVSSTLSGRQHCAHVVAHSKDKAC